MERTSDGERVVEKEDLNRTCANSVDDGEEEEPQEQPLTADQEDGNRDGEQEKGEEGEDDADGETQEQPSTVDGDNRDGAQEEEEEDDDRVCYICWEGPSSSIDDGDDDKDETTVLRRDCGCTGSTGWVHASCLIELAESRIQISDPLVRPWSSCSQCTQAYRDPTKDILEKALLMGSRERWRKQILAGIQSGGAALLFPCVYFGAHSVLGCILSFWLDLVVAILDALQPAWETASDGSKAAIYLVVGCLIAVPIVKCRWQIGRACLQAATVLSIAVLFACATVPAGFLFPDWGTFEISTLVGCCTGVLSYQAYNLYRVRGVVRHELLQIRRRGAWAALFQVLFIGTLVFLHTYIDDFIFFKYVRFRNRVDMNEVVLGIATTTTTTGRQITATRKRVKDAEFHEALEHRFHARRMFTKQSLSVLLEEMYQQLKEKEAQQLKSEQFREDYLYWSCCS